MALTEEKKGQISNLPCSTLSKGSGLCQNFLVLRLIIKKIVEQNLTIIEWIKKFESKKAAKSWQPLFFI